MYNSMYIPQNTYTEGIVCRLHWPKLWTLVLQNYRYGHVEAKSQSRGLSFPSARPPLSIRQCLDGKWAVDTARATINLATDVKSRPSISSTWGVLSG